MKFWQLHRLVFVFLAVVVFLIISRDEAQAACNGEYDTGIVECAEWIPPCFDGGAGCGDAQCDNTQCVFWQSQGPGCDADCTPPNGGNGLGDICYLASGGSCTGVGGGGYCQSGSHPDCEGGGLGDGCGDGGTCTDGNGDGICTCNGQGGGGGDNDPIGFLDGFACTYNVGSGTWSFEAGSWAGDPDAPGQPITIDYYVNSVLAGNKIGDVVADYYSQPDAALICSVIGGSNCSTCDVDGTAGKCKHRSNTKPLVNLGPGAGSSPGMLTDGSPHTVIAVARNLPPTGGDTQLPVSVPGNDVITCTPPPAGTKSCSVSVNPTSITPGTSPTDQFTLTVTGNNTTATNEVVRVYIEEEDATDLGLGIPGLTPPAGVTLTRVGAAPNPTYYRINGGGCTANAGSSCSQVRTFTTTSSFLPDTYYFHCEMISAAPFCSGNPFCGYERTDGVGVQDSDNVPAVNCNSFQSCKTPPGSSPWDNAQLLATQPPVCTGMGSTDWSVTQGVSQAITITANGVADDTGVTQVEFRYALLSNNSCTQSVLIGVDSSSVGGWTYTWNPGTLGLTQGTYDVFARVTDNTGVSCTGSPDGTCGYSPCAACAGSLTVFPPPPPAYTVSGYVNLSSGTTGGFPESYCTGSSSHVINDAQTWTVTATGGDGVPHTDTIDAAGFYSISNVPNGTVALVLSGINGAYVCQCNGSGSSCSYSVDLNEVDLTESFDFFVSNQQGAWWQSVGGDLGANGGSGDISSSIPVTCSGTCTPNATIRLGGANTSGVAVHVPGGTLLPAPPNFSQETDYNASSTMDLTARQENYDYFWRLFEMGDMNPAWNDNSLFQGTDADRQPPAVLPTLPTCTVPSTGRSAYYYGGDLRMSGDGGGSYWNIASGQCIVVFVQNNLYIGEDFINARVTVAPGGFLAFIVGGDIHINRGVGHVALPGSTNTRIEGVYIADGMIDDDYFQANPQDLTRKLVGGGIFTAWGGFDLKRDYGTTDNNTNPAELFRYRPDLVLNAPNKFKRPWYTWQEVAP